MTQAETGLVRALLALADDGPPGSARWTLVAGGPCDALLVDASEPHPNHVQQARGARAAAVLGASVVVGEQPALTRPLQAEPLLRWLGTVAPAAAAERGGGQAAHPPAAPAPRFMLRRWPPTQLMRGDTARLRMAAVLSRRHLNAGDLATLTQQKEADCRRFLQLLHGFQLLEPEPAGGARANAPAAPAVRPSLLQSIRRRLGL